MHELSLSALIPTLQVAIGPVVLISGVGLLLLSMTNRLGRIIDRTHVVARELRAQQPGSSEVLVQQLKILTRRALLIRHAIVLASLSVLFAATLIIVLFLSSLFQFDIAWLIGVMFIVCMLCLIVSLVLFIADVNQTLLAVRLDLGDAGRD